MPRRAAAPATEGGSGGSLPSTSPSPEGARGRGGRGSGPTGRVAHSGTGGMASLTDSEVGSTATDGARSPSSQRAPQIGSSTASSASNSDASRAYQLSSCGPVRASRGPNEPVMNSASCARVNATYSNRQCSCIALALSAASAVATGPTFSSLVRPGSGTTRALAPGISSESTRSPAPSGLIAASARMTIGASNPLDPCTVITRTWSPPSPASRFSSPSPASNQRMKPCRLAVCAAA